MNNKYYQALQTIKTCIDNIENFIGKSNGFELYDGSLLLQAAVERNLEIIGEATKRLLEINPAIALSNTRSIMDMTRLKTLRYGE